MSYALRIAPDAYADLHEIDPWLQEDASDAIEKAASAPGELRTDKTGQAIVDFSREISDERHIVFVRLHVDHQRGTISVMGIRDVRPHSRRGSS